MSKKGGKRFYSEAWGDQGMRKTMEDHHSIVTYLDDLMLPNNQEDNVRKNQIQNYP